LKGNEKNSRITVQQRQESFEKQGIRQSKNLNVIKTGHWKEKGRRKIANESTKNASLSQHGWTRPINNKRFAKKKSIYYQQKLNELSCDR